MSYPPFNPSQFVSGSVGPITIPSITISPINPVSRKLNINWSVSGSTVVAGPDRTGQLVRHGDLPAVWLVRETMPDGYGGKVHTLVNDTNMEYTVGEDTFWPWGAWQKLA